MLRSMTVCIVAVSLWVTAPTPACAQYSRITPLVEAVKKAEPSVVGIYKSGEKTVSGTGMIISKEGLIVTNHHVVGKATKVDVVLHDGTRVPGDIVLNREDNDLAFVLIKCDKALKCSPPRKEADIILGETVIAIGHPLGYTDTVSSGIVSSLNREIELPTGVKLVKLLQTNATINPGNSGGPLLNINGEFIGVNCAVRGDAQGIAFAIRATTVIEVMSLGKLAK
jgi:S1-C subfamily serine protease